jgi:hypothetical protein
MPEYFAAQVHLGNKSNSVKTISLYACSGSTDATCESSVLNGYENLNWTLFTPPATIVDNGTGITITDLSIYVTGLTLYKHTYVKAVCTSSYSGSCTQSEMIPISGIPTPTPTPTTTPTPTPTPTNTPAPTFTPTPTPTVTSTPTPTPTVTSTPTVTPTNTPIAPNYEVQMCNNDSPSGTVYVVTSTGSTPTVGSYYKIDGLSVTSNMNGTNCWYIIDTTTNASSGNVSFGTSFTDCSCGTVNPYSSYKYTFIVGTGTTSNDACAMNSYYTISGDSATFTSCTAFYHGILNLSTTSYFAYGGNYVQVNFYNQDPIAHVGTNTYHACSVISDHSFVYLKGAPLSSGTGYTCAQASGVLDPYTVTPAGTPLQNGTVIYDIWTTDYLGNPLRRKAGNGYYSDGTYIWTISDGQGTLSNRTLCPLITSWNVITFTVGLGTDADQNGDVYQATPNAYIKLNAAYSATTVFNVIVDGWGSFDVTIPAHTTSAFGYGTTVGANNSSTATSGCINSSSQSNVTYVGFQCPS